MKSTRENLGLFQKFQLKIVNYILYLQGSLAIDVDIKDYDSTTKDDDIDHLFYTFTSIASTEKVTVMLNGTRVRYETMNGYSE